MGIRRSATVAVVAMAMLLVGACTPTQPGPTVTTTTAVPTWTPPGPGHGVRLNQIQLIGTHNSYHVGPIPHLLGVYGWWFNLLGPLAAGFGNFSELDYRHAPLTDQLNSGVRSLELDVWADPLGGKFAHPSLATLLGVPEAPQPPAEMSQPGFKVLHIVDLDWNSTCYTLTACLSEIKAWSDAHPGHLPIVIDVELKDDPLPAPLNITPVTKIDGAQEDALDAEIRSVLPPAKLLTPDDVRGGAATLHQAVTTTGWPTVDSARGKVMFYMDNEGGNYRTDYLAGHPSLSGRVLFTSSGEGQDDGAVLKENTPGDGVAIKALVAQGYFIRTRADEALVGDTARRDTAFASGAQIVSTDFPVAEPQVGTGYSAAFGTGTQARCNPIAVAATCAAIDISG